MKILLIIILLILLIISNWPDSKPIDIDWSNKYYPFTINQTNRVYIITGLRNDGVIVWKLKPENYTYEK